VATTRKRPLEGVAEPLGGIRRAAARLGLPAREARALVQLTEVNAPDGGSLGAFLGDVLVDRSLEHGWPRSLIRHLLATVAEASGRDREELATLTHARAARHPSLLALSPALAIETQLRILQALAPVEDVSLWSPGPDGAIACRSSLGRSEPTRRTRLAARELLEDRPSGADSNGLVKAVPVARWQSVEAALVFRAAKGDQEEALIAARETAAALAPVLERESLLVRNAARERALVTSGERLLTRIGFDLHDGPIQDLAALAGDLRLLRQKTREREEPLSHEMLFGFFDDVEARVRAIDRVLRDLVHSLESPAVARRPLGEVLAREVESFRTQTDIVVELSVTGDLDALTASQRIALVRIVQESLSNAREHGDAQKVSIALAARSDRTVLDITDDGRGFDVPRTLVRAAQRGRFGLLGMNERARLLGGRFDVQSRAGGPTSISVVLPVWQPALAPAATQPALLS
jgi:signal transduction histidine kinase